MLQTIASVQRIAFFKYFVFKFIEDIIRVSPMNTLLIYFILFQRRRCCCKMEDCKLFALDLFLKVGVCWEKVKVFVGNCRCKRSRLFHVQILINQMVKYSVHPIVTKGLQLKSSWFSLWNKMLKFPMFFLRAGFISKLRDGISDMKSLTLVELCVGSAIGSALIGAQFAGLSLPIEYSKNFTVVEKINL